LEDFVKYKYQFESLKETSEIKAKKLKEVEYEMMKKNIEIDEINKLNYPDQILKLKG